MKNLKLRMIVPALLAFLTFAVAGGSAEARIIHSGMMSINQARSVALDVHHGRVVSETVGHTRDGEKAYRFLIRNRSGLYSVGVNAANGRVIENLKERRVHRHNSNGMDRLFAPVHWG